MGKAVTKTDENRQELTGAQLNALAALLGGASITDAATAAGVQRQTVHEWLRQAQFVIVLNTGRAELWELQQNALRALGDKANAVLDTAMDSDDAGVALKAALGVARAIAALGPPHGPKTAEDWVMSNWSTFG
jgi:transposase-like protein